MNFLNTLLLLLPSLTITTVTAIPTPTLILREASPLTPISAAMQSGQATISIFGNSFCGAHLQDINASPRNCHNTIAAFSSWSAPEDLIGQAAFLTAFANPGCAGPVVNNASVANVCHGFSTPGASFELQL